MNSKSDWGDEDVSQVIKECKYSFCPRCFRAFLVDQDDKYFTKYYEIHLSQNCVEQRGVLCKRF